MAVSCYGGGDIIKRRRFGAAIVCLFIAIPALAFSELKVHFIDVGQGDAILVQCDGETLLVDAGSADAGETVNRYLTIIQRLENVDYVIATHEHDDHLGGMIIALHGLSVGHIYSSPLISSSYWFQTVLPILKQDSLDISYPAPMDSFKLGGATVTFVNTLTEAQSSNDSSLAIRIEYEDNSVLLTADIETEAEADMLRSGVPISSDVLKIAHHGGNTSCTEAFIRAVSPTIAIISVGAGNSHGHPHAEPLRMLEKQGVIIYRTDYYGTIICTSNGKEWTVEVSKAR